MSRSAVSKKEESLLDAAASPSGNPPLKKEARRQDYIEVSARVNTLTYEIP